MSRHSGPLFDHEAALGSSTHTAPAVVLRLLQGFLLVQLASFARIVAPWFFNFTEIEGLATGSDVFFKIILSFIKFGDMDPSVLLRRTFSSIASFASFIQGGLCQLSFQRLHFHSSIRLGSSDFFSFVSRSRP